MQRVVLVADTAAAVSVVVVAVVAVVGTAAAVSVEVVAVADTAGAVLVVVVAVVAVVGTVVAVSVEVVAVLAVVGTVVAASVVLVPRAVGGVAAGVAWAGVALAVPEAVLHHRRHLPRRRCQTAVRPTVVALCVPWWRSQAPH